MHQLCSSFLEERRGKPNCLQKIPLGNQDPDFSPSLLIPRMRCASQTRTDLVLITLLVTVLEKEIERNGWLNKGKQNEVLC